MFCAWCGSQYTEEMSYCGRCGRSLPYFKKAQRNKVLLKYVLPIALVVLVVIIAVGIILGMNEKISIIGKWHDEGGTTLEFFSDGTMSLNGESSSMHPMCYEVLEEGYLKIGVWDGAWIAYDYTTFTIESASRNRLVLSSGGYSWVLTRE